MSVLRQGAAGPGAAFEIKGWHVLLALLGFFGAVSAVDVGMAVQAYRTFPGEVSASPYEDGLQFNRTLAERAEARALGWKASVRDTRRRADGFWSTGSCRARAMVVRLWPNSRAIWR